MGRFNRLHRAVCTLAMFGAVSAAWAQPATQPAASQPATKPAARAPLTPEQEAIRKKIYSHDPATLSVKLNPNTGEPDPRFLAAHERFLTRAKQGNIDLLFIGDSITAGWNREVWTQHFGSRNAANFGIGGDRTEHVLWRIENGELDGISPKVVVLLIGTNNTGAWKPEQIAAGITEIVKRIHAKLPQTKVLLLGIFPRGAKPTADNGKPSPYRQKIQQVNEIIRTLDDGDKTRYLDFGAKFLSADGTIPKELMHDALHLTADGYRIWAESIEPLLNEMMK